ncbi:uncharacterized protein SPAPADRAFT_71623 [Spathaspora passalidarum NRRL Y-27907]|uniref:DUF3835 domain-containing protein n=1 Tax=Spathaspora passalidarum (strain NRRL Y-27907 / 11-Y1) TaxID=619300 RepID=G3APF3_SPAPN|nr:uncharacterized protein SPAPADRAFT_71623 [Spathaspora passalidarum NRRL Y-27907]EGW32130.1 hypothetical protein SPAPADRAFT_71623 [Spathaspora passalidarum NRRL Y-27907]
MDQINDEDYAASLTKQMDTTISNLIKKRDALQTKIQEYHDVKSAIQSSNKEPLLISLGAGYFTEMSKPEAIVHLEGTISRMNGAISEISSNINHATDTKKKFLLFNDFIKQNGSQGKEEEEEEKLNEEGLPFMDIQEEIDEDGNVINVKINDTPVDKPVDSGEKLNEEGLPFMDIQEEIDDDGNVISVKINDAPVDKPILSSKQQEKNTSQTIAGTSYIEEKIEDVAAPSVSNKDNTESEETTGESSVDQIQELMEDMGLTTKSEKQMIDQDALLDKIDELEIETDHKFHLKQIVLEEYKKLQDSQESEQPQDNQNYEQPQDKSLAIDKYDDLIQLEIVADDLNDEQDVSYADDEEWDFEFDEDEDDDDLADELLYGNHPSSVLGASASEKTNALLWEQIRKLREKGDEKEEPKKKKSVRFAETLEINEIENISESLKNPPPPEPKMSLFKQNRIVHKQVEEKSETEEPVTNDQKKANIIPIPTVESISTNPPSNTSVKEQVVENTIMENTIVEHGIETKSEIVSNDIVEYETDESFVEVPKAKPISKFKAARLGKTTNTSTKTVPRDEAAKIPIPTVESTSKPEETTTNEPIADDSTEIEIKETQLDYSSLNQDMDTMAKAYILGMYDDDIATEGPVVDQLEDFEILNQMIESMPSKEPAKKKKVERSINSDMQFDETLDEIGMNEIDSAEEEEEEYFEEVDDGPILAEDIVEKEIDSADFDDNEILTSEINENYHKLRNKLILDQNGFKKTQQELEIEPVDEEGNPIKISRFRAARMRGGINGLK